MTGWERLKNLWKLGATSADDFLLKPSKRPASASPYFVPTGLSDVVIQEIRRPAIIMDLSDNVRRDFPAEEQL